MLRFHVFAILLAFAAPALATPGDILTSIPTPGHAPTGLAFDGNYLWLADRLSDTLYAIDPATGAVVKTLPAPGFVPLGLAWDGEHLWCLDGEENGISELDISTGITLRSFESPMPGAQGLAWDGKYLWLCDDVEDKICQLSVDDGTTTATYVAPADASTGLTWWNGYLWCADRKADKLYLFDPAHGEVVFGMNAPGRYTRGLATDGKVLWNVDYQDDRIYALVLDDGAAVQIRNPRALELTLTHEFRNYGPGDVPTLDVYIAVPDSLPNQKLLGPVTFDPAPLEIIKDQWQQPVAHFHREQLKLAGRERITMHAAVELSDTRTFVYPHRVGKLSEIPQDVRKAYLVDEDKYRIHDSTIVDAARAAIGGETNPYWMMRAIHKYLREHLFYELAGGWNIAPEVLKRGNGSCSEYAFVFIAMCRAAGIPSRYVGTVVVRGDDASSDDVFHRWCQVYLPPYGWVHVDPSGGDKEQPAEVAESIGNVENRFLITTAGGGASKYLGWGYNCDQRWTGKGPVKVHMEAVGEWSPLPSATGVSKSESSALPSDMKSFAAPGTCVPSETKK